MGAFLPSLSGITCYSCQQKNVVNGSCTLSDQTEWCNTDKWCVKTWRNEKSVSWGCEKEGPTDEYEGCTTEMRESNVEDTVCYCNTDMCNQSWVRALDTRVAVLCFMFYVICSSVYLKF